MKKITVMCFGTFDLLHPGHISYLEQAKNFGNYLLVVIARDANVSRLKGRSAIDNEKERLGKVNDLSMVDRTVLGNESNKMSVVSEYKPDIIALGYDQLVDLDKLKSVFKGKIVRMKAYREKMYKSSKLRG